MVQQSRIDWSRLAMTSRFRNTLKRIEARLRRTAFSPVRWISRQVSPQSLTRLGTAYGGWTFHPDPSLENGKVLLCGAGEDISFDLAIQKQFHCEVAIIDPTPRAVRHFESVQAAHLAGERHGINNSSSVFYDLDGVNFPKIHFVPIAVWSERSKVRFWEHYDNTRVSRSITNYLGTSKYIEVDADTLRNIINVLGMAPQEVSLIKLDIEGAEYAVIEWMCSVGFLPIQLLVEFDEMNFPNMRTSRRTQTVIRQLLGAGYKLIYFDGRSNCSFLKMGN